MRTNHTLRVGGNMEFNEKFKIKREEVEEIIARFLPEEEGYQKVIFEAMNYSLRAGGKRIRPMLMMETYRVFGGTNQNLLAPFMAAMEMIHTYSLVHDDLPAMDNDEFRRGRPTTHVVFGEAFGILAGDALLNYAFETAMLSFDLEGEEAKVAKALRVLSKKAGVYGMIGGQVVDVESCNQSMEIEKLDFIYHLKTSALIEASMMIGAILAGAKEEDVTEIEQIARAVGLAFQIQDDILDVTSTTQELGKPVLSDEKNNKTTYVTLLGIEKATKKVKEYTNIALESLSAYNTPDTFLHDLLTYLIHRKN